MITLTKCYLTLGGTISLHTDKRTNIMPGEGKIPTNMAAATVFKIGKTELFATKTDVDASFEYLAVGSR